MELKVTAHVKSVTHSNEFNFSLKFKGQHPNILIEDRGNFNVHSSVIKTYYIIGTAMESYKATFKFQFLLLPVGLWNIQSPGALISSTKDANNANDLRQFSYGVPLYLSIQK
jgi:hypothetical protein